MFVWDNCCLIIKLIFRVKLSAVIVLILHSLSVQPVFAERYGIGTPATKQQIMGWDIDIRPDGAGLPPGKGTVADGEEVYLQKCAACHGEFGEALGRYPVLMGGYDSLTTDDPVKTIGSYWPYASTVFDYVRRAMPFGHAQSLSNNEVYAITAFLLNINEIIDDDFVVDATSLPKVQMPNRNGFIADDRPDVQQGVPCMTNCRGPVKLVGKARIIDVTPEEETQASQASTVTSAVDASSNGKLIFGQCVACHSLAQGIHMIGPSLHGLIGRKAAVAVGFERYSEALKNSGLVWTKDNLSQFLAGPQKVVPGTSMPFAGISDQKNINNLIEYLGQN